MKLWIDDVRQPPSNDWIWCTTTNEAMLAIHYYAHHITDHTIIIDLDHDAGDYVQFGGDYIEILNWLEEQGCVDTGYFFHIHSMNPVGVQNMRNIIKRNGWKEL